MRWPELAALLRDCCEAGNLPAIERALAHNALDWLIRVGVDRDTADIGRRQVSG
jgi:hypothetical protein